MNWQSTNQDVQQQTRSALLRQMRTGKRAEARVQGSLSARSDEPLALGEYRLPNKSACRRNHGGLS